MKITEKTVLESAKCGAKGKVFLANLDRTEQEQLSVILNSLLKNKMIVQDNSTSPIDGSVVSVYEITNSGKVRLMELRDLENKYKANLVLTVIAATASVIGVVLSVVFYFL